MLLRPRTMRVPKDVVCPSCGRLVLEEGEIANIELPSLYDDGARLVQLVCNCDDCGLPVLIGYVPAKGILGFGEL